MLPFAHLHVRTDGKVAACCDDEGRLGDVREQSLREIWNGEPIRQLGAKMLKGETVPERWRCDDRERSGGLSLRQSMNKVLAPFVDVALTATPDGRSEPARPVHWDIRLSTICNLW